MTNPYSILGTEIAAMYGRKDLFAEICRHLTKETPDHLTIVGPKHYGKTVILKHLGDHFSKTNDHYLTSVYWDLRHGTPATDADFLDSFATVLKKSMKALRPGYADFLEETGEGVQELIELLFDELQNEGQRLLVILDGFDHVLASSSISRNLWDIMRSFALYSSLRLVTGSRGRLRELCKSEESRTSDFWEIFYDTPLTVGHFDGHDWEGFIKPFSSHKISFDSSAQKELSNWTGGAPLLASALLREGWNYSKDGACISKAEIDKAAEQVLSNHQELLETLWDDCSVDMQADLVHLAEGKVIVAEEIPAERFRALEMRGFIKESGNKIKITCRLLEKCAQNKAEGVANLRRLFGDNERFEQNVRSLLELRLSQVTGADPELRSYVENAIRDLSPSPKESVVWARRIAECALALIWKAELLDDQTLPSKWFEEWKHAEEILPSDRKGQPFTRLPRPLGTQCFILRMITGTQKAQRVSKYVTKPTYLLVDHIQSMGDFGQHQEDDTSLSFASSFCYSAIELCASIASDFKK